MSAHACRRSRSVLESNAGGLPTNALLPMIVGELERSVNESVSRTSLGESLAVRDLILDCNRCFSMMTCMINERRTRLSEARRPY